MKLHYLRDFIAVARSGGIRPAARELKLTQPALSKSIQLLEDELGTPLFERSARGSALNAYGQAFLVRAEAVANELSRGREELQQMRGSMSGTVSVAVSSVVSLVFLPAVLKTFRERFPQAEVRVLEGTYPVIVSGLRDGSLDFAIGPLTAPPLADEFNVEELFQNYRCVVGKHNHPLLRARSLAALVDAHWVVTGAVGPRGQEFEEIFRSHGLRVPKNPTRCEALIALLPLLAGSDALAFLPYQWADSDVTSPVLSEIEIREVIPGPSTCLIRRNGLPLTPAADALQTIFRREATYYLKGSRRRAEGGLRR